MTILTDLSEVLIRGMPTTRVFVADDYDRTVAENYWRRYLATFPDVLEVMRGHTSEDEYWRRFFHSGRHWPFGILYAEGTLSRAMRLDVPGVLEIYQSARVPGENQDGMPTLEKPRIIVVSDHIETRIGELEKNHPGIWKLADDFVWSFEVGKVKRDPGYFEELLERFNLDPAETLLVDRSLSICMNAEGVGIKPILFDNANKLKASLKENGIIFPL